MNKNVESFYEQLANVTPSMRTAVQNIRDEIAHYEGEIAGLRKALAEAQKILYAIDPEAKPKPKQKAAGKLQPVSSEKINALIMYLQDFNGDTFSGPEVLRREDFNLMSDPTLRSALAILHDRGVI